MAGSQEDSRTALWLLGFFIGAPFICACGFAVALLVFFTDAGSAAAVTAQAVATTTIAWLSARYAVRRGAPKEIWIPIVVATVPWAAQTAFLTLVPLFRLLDVRALVNLETVVHVAGLAVTAFGPPYAAFRASSGGMAVPQRVDAGA